MRCLIGERGNLEIITHTNTMTPSLLGLALAAFPMSDLRYGAVRLHGWWDRQGCWIKPERIYVPVMNFLMMCCMECAARVCGVQLVLAGIRDKTGVKRLYQHVKLSFKSPL